MSWKGGFNTEDWSHMDYLKQNIQIEIKLFYIVIQFRNISVFCVFDQINADLTAFQKKWKSNLGNVLQMYLYSTFISTHPQLILFFTELFLEQPFH